MTTPADTLSASPAGPTAELARFVSRLRFEDLPASVVTRLSQCLLDFIGVTVGGSAQADSSPAVINAVRSLAPPDGPATCVGHERGYPWQYAALLNGAFAHSLDFDDTNITSALHPGAPVIPAALAVAEREDATGAEFLTALAAGYETCCRVGAALGQSAYDRGFHPTAIAGLFGAVAAGARLMNTTAEQLTGAFGVAGSMAAGSMQYLKNGSWNKRLHPGLAAHNAILSLALTASGFHGAEQALEGRHGLLNSYSDAPRPQLITDGLGEHWLLSDTGIKPYPACRLAHGAIDAALRLRQCLGGAIPPSAEISVRVSPRAYAIVGTDESCKTHPANTVDAQFSVYFQTSVALLDGAVDWSSYQRLGDADVLALTKRLHVTADDRVPDAGAVLTCCLDDGRTSEIRVDQPSGEPGGDLPWEPVEAKYYALVRTIYEEEQARGIVQQVRTLPEGVRIRSLARRLRT
ncbi:MmgE/PrpD family protein [Streptomyces sp. S465]|uniref:MmgE/PrpD family protein n=1 Tax=Streptomyces sp. S465 TaxID=2979468 RepID=UPI0022A872C9|nr:MmgE/PrpD family protein [Streptomyces sp. S465]WAP55448.1 MmgE/PrpD family protein [Streptomyces sp. S465]